MQSSEPGALAGSQCRFPYTPCWELSGPEGLDFTLELLLPVLDSPALMMGKVQDPGLLPCAARLQERWASQLSM